MIDLDPTAFSEQTSLESFLKPSQVVWKPFSMKPTIGPLRRTFDRWHPPEQRSWSKAVKDPGFDRMQCVVEPRTGFPQFESNSNRPRREAHSVSRWGDHLTRGVKDFVLEKMGRVVEDVSSSRLARL
jgi:hypothetical protein